MQMINNNKFNKHLKQEHIIIVKIKEKISIKTNNYFVINQIKNPMKKNKKSLMIHRPMSKSL